MLKRLRALFAESVPAAFPPARFRDQLLTNDEAVARKAWIISEVYHATDGFQGACDNLAYTTQLAATYDADNNPIHPWNVRPDPEVPSIPRYES